MSEIEEGRRAALDIVKSQDVDVLVIQFAAGAVPPPEEIFEFFERITGLQQLHFFTPTFAQVGRPAYYRRDARLPPNPAQEGSAAHEEDTPSDTSEVDEEMREAALRYLLPERALEAIRAAKAAREATGLGDKKSDDRGIMASKQNRKRKRDDVEEMPLHASRDAPDTVDLKTTKREKKRSKKERKGKTMTEVMDSDDNRQAVSENEQSISQKSHRRPNNASTEDLAQGVVTMRDDQTSPVISESKESSPQKKEKKRDPSAMVERSVSAPDSVDSPSQDQYALDAAASGHDEQASGTKRKKEKKRRREREKPQPAEDASLAEPGDVEQSVLAAHVELVQAPDPAKDISEQPDKKQKKHKDKSQRKIRGKVSEESNSTELITDFETRAWSPSEPLRQPARSPELEVNEISFKSEKQKKKKRKHLTE